MCIRKTRKLTIHLLLPVRQREISFVVHFVYFLHVYWKYSDCILDLNTSRVEEVEHWNLAHTHFGLLDNICEFSDPDEAVMMRDQEEAIAAVQRRGSGLH